MGDSLGRSCRAVLASLSRTKQAPAPGPLGLGGRRRGGDGEAGGGGRWAPCRLARHGVGHGGSLAVGVFVVVGYATGEVAGPSALLGLTAAAFVCLITGYCYAEYTSHYPTRCMPATAYHYVYMLSGEFPAVLAGWCQVLACLGASAMLGRAVGANFDHLLGDPVRNLTAGLLVAAGDGDGDGAGTGDNASSEAEGWWPAGLVAEPEPLGFGAVGLVAALVCLGGKPLALANGLFGVLSCLAALALVVLAGVTLSGESLPLTADIFPEGLQGVMRGAVISLFLFSSYDVILTSSKSTGATPSQTGHALAISSLISLVFYLTFGMFCLLVAPYPWTPGGPLLLAGLFQEEWGDLALYVAGIGALLCLGSALFNNMCSLVYSVFLLGNDGLAFRCLGAFVSRLQSPLASGVLCGLAAGALAAGLGQDTLLELTGLGLLVKQLIICACTLSHRRQQVRLDVDGQTTLEDLLENGGTGEPQAEHPKKPALQNGKRPTNHNHNHHRHHHHHHHHHHRRTKDSSKEDRPEETSVTVVEEDSPAVMADPASERPLANGKTVRFRDDDDDESSSSSGASDRDDEEDKEEEEVREETDIDAVVEEYRDRLRLAAVTHLENPRNRQRRALAGRRPSATTSGLAAAFSLSVCAWLAGLAALLARRLPSLEAADPWTLSGLLALTVATAVSLAVVVGQPSREVRPAFRTPLYPLLPLLGIFSNVFLLVFVSAATWVIFAVLLGLGLCVYVVYGVRHNVEAKRFAFRQPDEERILLPSLPEQDLHQEFVNGQTRPSQNIGYGDFHESP